MKHLACVLFCLLLLPFISSANEKAQGYCTQGGQVVVTPPNNSTTKVMQSYPSCTVTVYVSGTLTLATIYSDNSNTPLSNPFTANSVGLWFFYGGNGRYDVKLSGGGIPSPFTLGDILLLDAAAGGGIVSSVTGSTGISVSPTSGAVVVTNTWGTPIPTQTTFPSPFPTVTNRNNNSYWLGTRFQYNNGTGYDFHGQPDPAGAMVVDLVVPATASDSAIAGAAIIGRGVTFGSTGAVGVQGLGFVAVNSGSGWGGVSYVQPDISGSYGSSFHATINGMIGFGHEADCNMFADGSGNAQGQCISFWAAGSSDLQTTGDSSAFSNGALGGVKTGNLSTNGTAVTRISGAWFDAAWPTQNSKIVLCPSSTPCTSGGTTYTISNVNSVSSLTLGSSAGVNANLAYYIGSFLPWDYGFRSYNGRANIGIRLGTLHDNNSTDLGGYTGVWPSDQSQPIYFDNLNSNVSQTSVINSSAAGVFQINSPSGVQFITNAAKQGFFFDAQDGIGITGDPNTAQTVESRYIAAGFSGNSYDGRITVAGGTNGTNGYGTMKIEAKSYIGGGLYLRDMRLDGAVCDGTTNNYSVLTSEISAGFTAFFLPANCVIVAPASNYNLQNNISIYGQGSTSVIKTPTPSASQFLNIGQNSDWHNVGIQDAFCYQNAYPQNSNKTCYLGGYYNNDLIASFHGVQTFNYSPFTGTIGNVNALDTIGANLISAQQYGDGGAIYGQMVGGSAHSSGSGIHADMSYAGATGQGLLVTRSADGVGGEFLDTVGGAQPSLVMTGAASKTGPYISMFHGSAAAFSGNAIQMNFQTGGIGNWSGNYLSLQTDGSNTFTVTSTGAITEAGVAFANLGTPSNGTLVYCTNCTIANPCASGGSGAFAKRLNGSWICN